MRVLKSEHLFTFRDSFDVNNFFEEINLSFIPYVSVWYFKQPYLFLQNHWFINHSFHAAGEAVLSAPYSGVAAPTENADPFGKPQKNAIFFSGPATKALPLTPRA